MYPRHIFNLIRLHYEKDEKGFAAEVRSVIEKIELDPDPATKDVLFDIMQFSSSGILEAAKDAPYDFFDRISREERIFFKKVPLYSETLWVPQTVADAYQKIQSSLHWNPYFHRVCFYGGSELRRMSAVRKFARKRRRTLYEIPAFSFRGDSICDSIDRIQKAFRAMSRTTQPKKVMFVLNDIHNLSILFPSYPLRLVKALYRELSMMREDVWVFMTAESLAPLEGLQPMFDEVLNFDAYEQNEVKVLADALFAHMLDTVGNTYRNPKLLKKILALNRKAITTKHLTDSIARSVAITAEEQEKAYVGAFYEAYLEKTLPDFWTLKKEGFSVREIEVLTGVSKSVVDRKIQEAKAKEEAL